jgi:hypothetical protein
MDELTGATILEATENRWDVWLRVQLTDGTEKTLVFSADSYFTDNNGIWVGTNQEWENEHYGI